MEITFDLSTGYILMEGAKISLNACADIAPYFKGVVRISDGLERVENELRLEKKFITLGSNVSLVVRYDPQLITSVCFLFDEIIFFNETIMESKIIKRFERKYGLKVQSSHPTIGGGGDFAWGKAYFLYDPLQGDLSLCFSWSS